MRSSAAVDLVEKYMDRLHQAVAALDSQMPRIKYRAGRPPEQHEGTLPDVGTFRMHGAGCAVDFSDGAHVDFDWSDDLQPIFDGWRLRRFAASLSIELSTKTADKAAKDLQRQGRLLSAPNGWFTPTPPS